MSNSSDIEEYYLKRALELSLKFSENADYTPFGALLVSKDKVLGEGISSVVPDCDPTAHAEVNALRDAGRKNNTHLFPGSIMYCSGYPCSLCYAACLWAQVEKIIYLAPLEATRAVGFEDQSFYKDLQNDPGKRLIPVVIGGSKELQEQSTKELLNWKNLQK